MAQEAIKELIFRVVRDWKDTLLYELNVQLITRALIPEHLRVPETRDALLAFGVDIKKDIRANIDYFFNTLSSRRIEVHSLYFVGAVPRKVTLARIYLPSWYPLVIKIEFTGNLYLACLLDLMPELARTASFTKANEYVSNLTARGYAYRTVEAACIDGVLDFGVLDF